MTNVLILGAAGSLARVATRYLTDNTQANLTLYLRNAARLRNQHSSRVSVIEGDVMDTQRLREAMQGQDIVYANLAGNMKAQAEKIIEAMQAAGVKRLIFISSMGIYDEVPDHSYDTILDPYRDSAKVIEASGLDYTIIRPGWFTNGSEIDYQTTHKGQLFQGHSVSRISIADLICRIVSTPDLYMRDSVGIARI